MSPLKTFPPLIPRLCSNFLPFFAALALLLVASGLNVTIGAKTLVQSWQTRLVNHVLITIPPSSSQEEADPSYQKEILLKSLQTIPQGHDIKIMTDDEIKHLMAQWGSSWASPLPFIAQLTYSGDKHSLEERIRQTLPEAVVIFPPDIMQWLPSVIRPLQLASNLVSFFLILTGELLFVLSFLLSLSHGWQKHIAALRILFYNGCSEPIFWHSLRCQIGWRCLLGGYAGLIIMVPFLNIMTSILRPILHIAVTPGSSDTLFFHNPFGPVLTFILLLWPILNTLIGWGLAVCFFRHPSLRFYE